MEGDSPNTMQLVELSLGMELEVGSEAGSVWRRDPLSYSLGVEPVQEPPALCLWLAQAWALGRLPG